MFDLMTNESNSLLTTSVPKDSTRDLVVFSHLRWDFVYQRPQHLMTRFGRMQRVFFFEEPILTDGSAYVAVRLRGDVLVVVPHLPQHLSDDDRGIIHRTLVDQVFHTHRIQHYVLWYYTPMALAFTDHLQPLATVHDCMDELSLFKNAPPVLREYEQRLLRQADVVFTGGQGLYEAKRHHHANVHPFPSSIDYVHFAKARQPVDEPANQRDIPHPRLGFYGVVDERFDIELLAGAAAARPDWHFVIIGPVVKIAPEALPQAANIHYLGMKRYDELPAYLAGWDIALLLFARNDATRFISPTKTPEYLAGGKPVISTSILDVVRVYGEQGLVSIADRPDELVRAAEEILQQQGDRSEWLRRVDAFLAQNSWDQTWAQMQQLIDAATQRRLAAATPVSMSFRMPAETLTPLESGVPYKKE